MCSWLGRRSMTTLKTLPLTTDAKDYLSDAAIFTVSRRPRSERIVTKAPERCSRIVVTVPVTSTVAGLSSIEVDGAGLGARPSVRGCSRTDTYSFLGGGDENRR